MAKQIARASNRNEDYQRFGVDPDTVEPWEDGLRTKVDEKNFEWWYFDASLDDGSSVVATFMTKDPFNLSTELKPWVSFEWTDTQGKTTSYRNDVKAADFSAKKQYCDVHIGKSYLTGDLRHYELHFEKDDFSADLSIENDLKSWRPAAGANLFGDGYFAWLPAVPAATVTGTIRSATKELAVRGKGYHDHNWGDTLMLKAMHHWYWGRANVGDYQVISTETTAEKTYGYQKLPVMMIADHEKIISGDESNMIVEDSDDFIDESTKKPVQKNLKYTVKSEEATYIVTYKMDKIISGFKMIDEMTGIKKLLAKLAGFDGAYLRFTGEIAVSKYVDNKQVDQAVNPDGIWELMYFGKTITED
ncbi:MAG TPA: lipocalin-like domain-containing protein [Tetragenococcus sp.]|nr:lipocalin-like domain-containing protein [Tetragenococcus sp.]